MPPVAATEAGPDGRPAWPRPHPRRGTAVQVPPQPAGHMGLAGLCHRPFAEGCTAQNAGDRGVAPPRRSTPGSPSSSRLALASLPQPDLEVRSLRNAARQYPCARPFVLSPRAARMSFAAGLAPRLMRQGRGRSVTMRRARHTALLWMLSAGICLNAGAARPGPNIVFILADDLGYGDLGCYSGAS